MPGSAGDPVRIGPFARIVSVGWDPLKYLAFYVVVGDDFQDNTSPVPLPPDPGPGGGRIFPKQTGIIRGLTRAVCSSPAVSN